MIFKCLGLRNELVLLMLKSPKCFIAMKHLLFVNYLTEHEMPDFVKALNKQHYYGTGSIISVAAS
jgi:hypothetical protein